MRSILIIGLLLLPSASFAQTAVYGGRTYTPQNFSYAYRCNCPMCQYIKSEWSRSRTATVSPVVAPKVVVETPKVVDKLRYETKYREETKTVYETQYRTETYQQKVCTGRRCYYVTKTRQVPIQVAKKVTVKVPYQSVVTDLTAPKVKKKAETKLTTFAKPAKSELIPTPLKAVKRLIEILKPQKSDVLIDAGCGDGRFLIAASESGCTAVGVEIDPQIVRIARSRIEATGSDAIVFQGDALKFDYSAASMVVIYQMPDLLADIVKEVPRGVKVASYMHDIPGVRTQKHAVEVDGEIKSIYVGVVGGELKSELVFGL